MCKVLKEGILRVGKSAAEKLSCEATDDWFSSLGDSALANKLRLYAQVSLFTYHFKTLSSLQTKYG